MVPGPNDLPARPDGLQFGLEFKKSDLDFVAQTCSHGVLTTGLNFSAVLRGKVGAGSM